MAEITNTTAKVVKLKKNGQTVYPITVADAVANGDKTVAETLDAIPATYLCAVNTNANTYIVSEIDECLGNK